MNERRGHFAAATGATDLHLRFCHRVVMRDNPCTCRLDIRMAHELRRQDEARRLNRASSGGDS